MKVAMICTLLVCILVAEAVSEWNDMAPPQIINGKDADLHEFPWHAKLMVFRNSRFNYNCGGSLISSQWVLTAAHCIKDYAVDRIKVYLGSHYSVGPTKGEIEISVEKLIPHENFEEPLVDNDIGLIKLKQKVNLTRGLAVKSIELASPNDHLNEGADVTLSGWGFLKEEENFPPSRVLTIYFCGGKFRPINDGAYKTKCGIVYVKTLDDGSRSVRYTALTLQKVTVLVWSERKCMERNVDVDQFWCVGNVNQGACKGDSGGPMVKKINGKWKLFGLTSHGNTTCTSEYPGVYTKVLTYLEWIKRNVANN